MTPCSISGLVRQHAMGRPTSTAIVEASTGRTVTWAELNRNVELVVAALISDGVARGDRVAYWGHNCLELFELNFAATRIGATFVPLNWNLNDDEIAALIAGMGATRTFADEKFHRRLPGAIRVGEQYAAWRDERSSGSNVDDACPDDVVVQPYTSGTTGVPKGVMLTNDNISAFISASEDLGYDESSAHLLSLPNYHIGGCVFPLLALAGGGKIVIVDRFTPASVLDTIEHHRITHINLVPTMINMVMDEQERHGRDVSSMRLIVYGAAPVTLNTVSRAQRILGVDLLQEYASTECLAITVLRPEEHTADKLVSVGRPFPGVEVQIRDVATGEPARPGQPGEIRVRSAQCAGGYWRRPDETSRLLAEDGFRRTGDLGTLDHEGFLRLTGRLKDMIVTGGENIYPAEVEAVLGRHPDIEDVAVVGVADERWGEVVTAYVVPRDGSALDVDAVLQWSHERLSGYRRPRIVRILEKLPRNATGKVERHVLRATPDIPIAHEPQAASGTAS